MKRAVISLHGIRTRGVWQKDLAASLALNGFIPYALDYGYLSVLKLPFPRLRQRHVDWLRDECTRVTEETRSRPSIVAHSYGTWVLAEMLDKYQELRFDKIILCGSIVGAGWNWLEVLRREQVSCVRNDYGRLDVWPSLAKWLIKGAGPSGSRGFSDQPNGFSATPSSTAGSEEEPEEEEADGGEEALAAAEVDPEDELLRSAFIQQEFPRHRHSDYFHRRHFEEHWIELLQRNVVVPSRRRDALDLMSLLQRSVAVTLGMDQARVRVNVPEGSKRRARDSKWTSCQHGGAVRDGTLLPSRSGLYRAILRRDYGRRLDQG